MLSVIGDGCFLPFRASLYLTVLMEQSIVAQNTCLQMCVVGRGTFIGAGSTFFGLVLGLPAAYAVARYKQYGIATAILIARIVPGITFLIPLFILFRQFQMIDTYQSLILAHMLVTLPFIVWVMVPFFESIPQELEEAARVDGASVLQAFFQIILPVSGPGIVTGAILAFVFSWKTEDRFAVRDKPPAGFP